jgi:hypothetical protein
MKKEIYQIVNRANGSREGSYSRAYHTEYEFSSVDEARNSNCHKIYQDKSKYKIVKYRVTYKLVDSDVDNAEDTPLHTEEERRPNEDLATFYDRLVCEAIMSAGQHENN